MKTLNKITSTVEKLQIILGSVNFTIFVIAVVCQVTSRMIAIPMTWTEDLANYNFIWAIFMGASVILNRNQHFRFTAVEALFKKKWHEIYNIFIYLGIMIFSAFILVYGIELTITFWDYTWNSIPSFKMGYHWLCVPIMGATMTWYSFSHILNHVSNIKNKKYKDFNVIESLEETEHINIEGGE